MSTNNCIICDKELGVMNYYFNKNMCDICICENIKLCTCDLVDFNSEPHNFMLLSVNDDLTEKNDSDQNDDKNIIKLYYETDKKIILELLSYYMVSKDTGILNCCNGCKYSDEQISNDITIKHKHYINGIVYKYDGNSIEYVGNLLDENFIKFSKSIGYDIGVEECI